ncbi:MAG: glycerol kinase GlpK [Bacteroidota bacterium]
MKYILSIDQGTTSCRTLLFNEESEVVAVEQKEFTQYFPRPGWVEHDPNEIWDTQLSTLNQVINKNSIEAEDIVGLGITNQRETTLVWDKTSGDPIHAALVWQDKRTADFCKKLKSEGLEEKIRSKTGLVIDSYFSASKVYWILNHVDGAKEKAENGELLFGTIDTWLIWKLTKGKVHTTDVTNASRTLLYNIHEGKWDSELLGVFGVPESMLPEVKNSRDDFGSFQLKGKDIPIYGVAGDQQAALFGQACFEEGMGKNTYGTGCFMLMNTGHKPKESKHGLLTTIAWGEEGKITYALEGAIFVAGAAVQWLRDGLHLIDDAKDSEYFASQIESNDGVYVVPAFTGLGAPYWDMYARGAVFGLTRDTGKNHLIRATLESMAYQTKDIAGIMEKDSGVPFKRLQVDGGACANSMLMQFQADVLGVPVIRPENLESTASGAAYLAGIQAGLWTKEEIVKLKKTDREFEPKISEEKREQLYNGWLNAVKRTLNWLED